MSSAQLATQMALQPAIALAPAYIDEVHVYDSPKAVTVLTEQDELVNESLLPGFRCRIGELLQQPVRA